MNYNSIALEYQKIINLLRNTPNPPTKRRTKNWVEINNDARGMYNTNSQTRFTTSILKSRLCDYCDAFILIKGTIIITKTGTAAAPKNRDKKVMFKNFTSFPDSISEINNTEINHAKVIDVVMPTYNLIEYSNNYLKTSESLKQHFRDEPFIDNGGDIIDIPDDPDTTLFNYKQKIKDQTGNNGTKDTQIMIPLKYLIKFWRILEMPTINCKINIFLT